MPLLHHISPTKTDEHSVFISLPATNEHRASVSESGFVALITVLIISAVLLVTVVSLAQYGITARFSLLDLENKTKSELLASACLAIARIAVVNDPSYAVNNKTIAIGNETCTTKSVSSGKIQTSATVDGATTNYEVQTNTSNGDVTSFRECKYFLSGVCK